MRLCGIERVDQRANRPGTADLLFGSVVFGGEVTRGEWSQSKPKI